MGLRNERATGTEPEASQPADMQAEAERLEHATDEAIAACGGDLRATVRALIVTVEFLEAEMERQVSHGFRRGVKRGRFGAYSG
jgi:hypothetical protein